MVAIFVQASVCQQTMSHLNVICEQWKVLIAVILDNLWDVYRLL